VATPQILKFKSFEHRTGGAQGIQLDPTAAPFGLPLNTDRWMKTMIKTIVMPGNVAADQLRGLKDIMSCDVTDRRSAPVVAAVFRLFP
jgi:hypothetical protein